MSTSPPLYVQIHIILDASSIFLGEKLVVEMICKSLRQFYTEEILVKSCCTALGALCKNGTRVRGARASVLVINMLLWGYWIRIRSFGVIRSGLLYTVRKRIRIGYDSFRSRAQDISSIIHHHHYHHHNHTHNSTQPFPLFLPFLSLFNMIWWSLLWFYYHYYDITMTSPLSWRYCRHHSYYDTTMISLPLLWCTHSLAMSFKYHFCIFCIMFIFYIIFILSLYYFCYNICHGIESNLGRLLEDENTLLATVHLLSNFRDNDDFVIKVMNMISVLADKNGIKWYKIEKSCTPDTYIRIYVYLPWMP